MSRQLSLFKYMPRRRCIEDDEATTSLQESTEDDRKSEPQEAQCSSVADQPQEVTERSGNVDDVALTSSSSSCQPANITFTKRPYSDKVSRSSNSTGIVNTHSFVYYYFALASVCVQICPCLKHS